MLLRTYLAIGAVLIGSYSVTSLAGWEFGSTKLKKIPPSVARASRGRSGSGGFFFWGGFGGGK